MEPLGVVVKRLAFGRFEHGQIALKTAVTTQPSREIGL